MKNPLEFAVNLSRTVGHLLRDRYESGNIEAKVKADTSLVTEADILADRFITQSILDEFPQDTILSEELNSVLINDGQAIWVIDPLDGTTNFTLGVQYWGISIARLIDGQPQIAVIYFPMINELYSADRDQGALLNGKQIHTKSPNRELPAAFFSCCSRTFRHYDIKIPFKPRIFGSAAFSFCAVARGIAVLGFEATPKIWDIAAGWLIVSEAGGVVETLDDQIAFPLNDDLDYSQKSFPTIIAAAPNLLPMARSHIKPKRILS